MKNIKLNDGHEIPQLGFGVFRIKDGDECVAAVKAALAAGYTHLDTAKIYGNEQFVGQAMKESGLKREDIYLTTKLWNEDIRQMRTQEAFAESLERLGTDYVDLYLIHWPVDKRDIAWGEMEKLQKEGKIRSIGVSNFHQHHLEELEKTWNIVPAVNQIESNPYFQNQELIDYCLARGIQVEVWSPLGGSKTTSIRDDETLKAIADKYGKTPTQVIIRWHLQRGVIVLPKSTHKERIDENFNVFDFELSEEDMLAIKGLERGTRVGDDPDNFNF